MVNFLNFILGSAVLVAGRKLFWLLVGTIGFVIGLEVARRVVHGPDIINLLAGLIIGLVFAMLAIFIESIAIGLTGFLGGGYALLSLAALLGLDHFLGPLVAFVVGGVLGVILIVALLDWALITISALAGASMIVGGLGLRVGIAGLVYAGLVLAGLLIQGFALRRQIRVQPEQRS
jgi:hypothetical protein